MPLLRHHQLAWVMTSKTNKYYVHIFCIQNANKTRFFQVTVGDFTGYLYIFLLLGGSETLE